MISLEAQPVAPAPRPCRQDMALGRGVMLPLGSRCLVMGILNVTPDSFSDGGSFFDADAAVSHAARMIEDGADILDVGAESTRPGAQPVTPEEQIRRAVPVIGRIRERFDVPISIDTSSSRVAEKALDAGADIVNDVTAFRGDSGMIRLLAERGAPAIAMHMQGTPRTMQQSPSYRDVVLDILRFLEERLSAAAAGGVAVDRVLVDPGFGFGKTLDHNLSLLNRLAEFHRLGRPLVVGTSRKAMIGAVLGGLPVGERLMGTAATVAASVARGAHVVRVHDVKQMVQVVRMTEAIEGAKG
ncbi:MAG TPA: dihydropteroate synthase [Candidatus Brocadiia bacterium]|nr:dihydropteroate synthase [Candidatus Brocadiia bacterium]